MVTLLLAKFNHDCMRQSLVTNDQAVDFPFPEAERTGVGDLAFTGQMLPPTLLSEDPLPTSHHLHDGVQ